MEKSFFPRSCPGAESSVGAVYDRAFFVKFEKKRAVIGYSCPLSRLRFADRAYRRRQKCFAPAVTIRQFIASYK
jgi:hypothetical protein